MSESGAKTSLDFLIENEALYRRKPEFQHKRNEYISSFVRSGLAARVKRLADSDRAMRKLVNHKKLRKEVTESYGALVQLERLLRRLATEQSQGIEGADRGGLQDESGVGSDSLLNFSALRVRSLSPTPLAVLDVCSGKGITAFLLALLVPSARVVMLDSNRHINREHLAHPACSNISFVCMDIHSTEFEQLMRAPEGVLPAHDGPSLWLVLGTHLCGHLSSRLASVFASTDCGHLPVLVLSPCCMPRRQSKQKMASKKTELLRHTPPTQHAPNLGKRRRTVSSSDATAISAASESPQRGIELVLRALHAVDTAALAARLRRNGWDPYVYWCLYVLLLLPAPALRRNLLRDGSVQSDKDAFITAVRCSALR